MAIAAPEFRGELSERFVTFGSVVRGLRLGYGWSYKHRCFVRIDAQGPPWQITLAPNGGIPAKFQGSKEHVVWWENDETKEILDTIKPLANVRGVKRVVQFHVTLMKVSAYESRECLHLSGVRWLHGHG